jgi:UDP-glucose 4-epimerase
MDTVVVPDVGPDTDWTEALRGARIVLHLAGRAHSNPAGDAAREAEVTRVNVAGTEQLMRAAIAAGVGRFVFVSSIGVNGSYTTSKAFTEHDTPAPADFYSRTKWEAEQVLQRGCERSSMQLVIVRPTLVAGPGAPGNLARLAKLIRKGIPVPIASAGNRRHLVGVRSLADLLVLACVAPAAAGRLFLAADDPPLSTAQIATEVATGLGTRARLLRIPGPLLKLIASLTGRSRDLTRIRSSLLIDSTAARTTLGWRSAVPIQAELREVGSAARASNSLK